MSDTTVPAPTASPLINLGGMLGIAASCIGLAIFMGGCFGYERAFQLAYLPLLAAGAGLVVTVLGGVLRRGGVEQTGIVAGLFVNVFGLIGGLLELAFWKGWPIFYRAVAS